MTADVEMAGAASARTSAPANGQLSAGHVLGGRYTIEGAAQATRIGAIYPAVDGETQQPVSVHVLHPTLVAAQPVRDAVIAAAERAANVDHKSIAHVLDVIDDGTVAVVSERLDGSSLRDLLARKQQTGGGGFGARGTANIIGGVLNAVTALGAQGHGALGSDTVFVNKAGRVKVAHLGLGAAVPAAVVAGIAGAPQSLAPEDANSGTPSARGDLYAVGHLLYEVLVGAPLRKGGQRPSDAVPGVTQEVDALIARACSPAPDKRPADAAAFKKELTDALATSAGQPRGGGARGPARPSLAQSIADPAAQSAPAIVPSGAATAGALGAQSSTEMPAQSSGSMAAASGQLAIDDALLADTDEKWLINKGRLDFGPFSIADVVEQIRTDQVLPGHLIIDKDTGERVNVEDHPLLAQLVDRAQQLRDDRRRAQAEVAHVKQEKKRGLALYAFILLGVAAVGVGAYFIVAAASSDDGETEVAGVEAVGEAELEVKISAIKKPPKRRAGRRGNRRGGGGGGSDWEESETLSLDGAGDLGTETLDIGTINRVIQGHGGRLGGCLGRTGSRYAAIRFIIKGPTGRVVWVRVNGKSGGALYNCIAGAMRAMKFPTVDGPRTRAEFDMSL